MNHSIGIDVGKAELVACIRASDGKTAIPAPFPNSIIGLKKLIVHFSKNNIGTDDPILLESTGPYHWKAARTLTDKGYLVKVANPLHTKQMARHSIRKRKTDKVDAGHLSFLASQEYGYRFVETEEMARKKALVRHYWKLRLTATNHSIHERYLKEYRGIGTHSISDLILKKCEKLKQEIIDEWDKGNDVKYLDSIPGLTPFLAITILAELLPIQRFERIDQIIAYAGLDPSVKQTGGKKGAATRWGKDDRPHKGGDKGGHEMVVTKPSPTVSPFDDTPFPSPFPSPVTTKTTTASISPNDGETRPTRTGEVTPADRPVKKARRPDTWLTPIGAAWERVNGPGSFPYAQAARELKPLVDAGIGPDEIARRLAWYLENKGSASVLPPDQLARKAFTPSVRDFRLRHGQFDPSAPSEAA